MTLILMMTGGNSGSTAGGAKTTTILLVLLTAASILKGEENVHIFGRRIENDLLRRAWHHCIPEGAGLSLIAVGGYGRGELFPRSDIDLLVIENEVEDRAREMVRLRRLLRPLRVPADILVYSEEEVERWGHQPGSALYWALREGKVVHG